MAQGGTVTADDGEVQPLTPLQPGTVFDRYVLHSHIGSGGMGDVYAAYDFALDRKVALKLQPPRVAGDERLLKEARAMAQLQHLNVVAVYDVGRVGALDFVAMQLIDGVNLRAWMRAQPRSWPEVLAVFLQAGEGLAAAHAVGLVHRDFKPENILIDGEGVARVTDFGLARMLEHANDTAGTPGYMAPEQLRGKSVGHAADQWAFCASLKECWAACRPPARLTKVLERGLSQNPADRHPSMASLLGQLRRRRLNARAQTAVALTLIASVALAAVVITQRPRCADGPGLLASAWNENRKQLITTTLSAVERPWSHTTVQSVTRTLDAWGQEFLAMHKEACEATRVHGSQSEALLDLRNACLRDRLSHLRAFTEVLEKNGAQLAERAAEASQRLPNVSLCGDLEALRRRGVPTPTPAQRPAFDEARAKLAEGTVRGSLAELKPAITMLTAAAEGALAVGDHQGRAMAQTELARALANTRAWAEAEQAAFEGYAEGNAAGDDAQALEAAAMAAFATTHIDEKKAARWLQLAEATATQVATDKARSRVSEVRAYHHNRAGHFEEALEAGRQALMVDPSSGAGFEVASALSMLGRDQEALDTLDRLLAMQRERLGDSHPKIIATRVKRAVLLANLDRLEESEQEFRVELAELERTGRLGPGAAITVANFSALLAERGKHDEAIELSRASIASVEKARGANDFAVATPTLGLAVALDFAGRPTESLAQVSRALKLFDGNPALSFIPRTLALELHAKLLNDLGRPQDALAFATRCLDERSSKQSGPLDVAAARVQLARALEKLKREPERAKAERAAAVRAFEAGGALGAKRLRRLGLRAGL